MSDATIHNILQTLRERGYRHTKARERIIATLAKSTQPRTIQELVALVTVDEASVYRTLELLRGEALVEVISITGEKPRYALAHAHHHHLVCADCGRVAHIPCTKGLQSPDLPRGFARIDAHEVTFYGSCTNCV